MLKSKQFDPDMDHLSSKDFDNVYEPNDDTWLFVDALTKEHDFIKQRFSSASTHLCTCVEIGVCFIKIFLLYYSRVFFSNNDASLAAVLSSPFCIIYSKNMYFHQNNSSFYVQILTLTLRLLHRPLFQIITHFVVKL